MPFGPPGGDPKSKNHISVLFRRDPKGKVLPGVVAIALWAPDPKSKNHISVLSRRDPKVVLMVLVVLVVLAVSGFVPGTC